MTKKSVLISVAVVLALSGWLFATRVADRRDARTPMVRLSDSFASARVSPDNVSAREGAVVLRRSQRRGVILDAPSRVTWNLDWTPFDRMTVEIGVRRAARSDSRAKVEFSVVVRLPDGAVASRAKRMVAIPPRSRESGWLPMTLDIGSLRGAASVVSLEARVVSGEGLSALWGSPVLFNAAADRRMPPDVFLISLDTVAARHMSLHGYERATTPELERFARDAVVFDQAITPQSWTLTAHASLMTSLYPDTHRVSISNSIPATSPLLPQILREHGYYAAGLINNPYLNPTFGYRRGYDFYDFHHELEDADGRRLKRSVEESNAILSRRFEAGFPRPLFFFYHLIDPHSDWRDRLYESPPPFDTMFTDGSSPGIREGSGFLARVNRGRATMTELEIDTARAEYDGGLAYTDHHLGRFFELLREQGRYDDALIIVTSDHGEEFLQHGRMMHTQGYEECLRIPMLIKFPDERAAGTRVDTQVNLLDVMPTILEVLEIPQPAGIEGYSLVPLVNGETFESETVFAKGENYSMTPRDVYVVRTPEWKLIHRIETGRTELYDLVSDPQERNDVAEVETAIRHELMDRLELHRSARDRGFRLRVPGHAGAGFEVNLETDGRFVGVRKFTTQSTPGLEEPSLSAGGSALRFRAGAQQTRAGAIGIDFDLGAGATWLTLDVRVGGQSVDPERVLLGGDRIAAQALPLRIQPGESRAVSRDVGGVDYEIRGADLRVLFWESQPPEGNAVRLTEKEREALRALGYLD